MIRFFAHHPTAANLLMLIMLASGILSLGNLRRETFPDALPTEVEILVFFPGATTLEVEETILQRLENALDGVQHLKEMTSFARQSVGMVTLEMIDGGDYTAFRNEIDNAVSSIDDFPENTEPPLITRLNTRQPVMDVLVAGPMTTVSLKAFCEQLRRELLREASVSEVKIDGFSDHLLRVEVLREALLSYGLSPADISAVIGNQSRDLPAGKIEAAENVLLRVEESRKSKQALEELIVAGRAGGAEIRLGDIATVRDEFELEEDKITVNGSRAAVLQILKSTAEDSVRVASAAQRLLQRYRQTHPQVQFDVINDRSELVVDRISLLVKNGWQGCLLVFATMWVFFNARLSFWVVVSLPVSFLGAFAIAPSLGLTINMLTMVGLLMALGLLMDDGIVIAENIARRHSEGEPAMEAAIHGVTEVAGGVLSSFLTTCSVLGPLMFLSGEIGKILAVLPMMLILVLATSLIEAFLILPAHLGHSLSHAGKSSRFRQVCEQQIDRGRDVVAGVVERGVRWRYLTAGCVMMVFLMTMGLITSGLVRFEVFPSLEGDTIVGRVLLPPGTPLHRTEQVMRRMEEALDETNAELRPRQPQGKDLILSAFVRYNQNTDANESGPHVATLQAELLTNELRRTRITEVFEVWRERLGVVPDAVSITFDEPAVGPAGRDLELQLSGESLEDLDAASERIQGYLKTFDGVYNITDDLRRGETELIVKLRPGALGLGITAADLGRQLRGSFQGLLSDQIQVGTEAYDVEVRYAMEDRNSLADLEHYRVTLPGGESVPMGEIASLQPHQGWSRIKHSNGRQVATVFGNVDSRKSNAMGVIGTLRAELMPELQRDYPGLQLRAKGSAERGAETSGSMRYAAMVGCLGVFVILSFQFRSYLEPLIVMAAIPFAFVGVVWGHLLFGMSISLPSLMGYASLCGIVVNDSILLVLFLKRRLENESLNQAAVTASRLRFRAVMITSLTTIAGLLPLLTEQSLQAQVLIPIAISICFGLLASTFLVLLVIPPLYVLIQDLRPQTPGSHEATASLHARGERRQVT